jgi:hypothetical protein
MRVLVACEFSGTVRDAFAARGHDAWSCDLLPSESKGNHIQGSVLDVSVVKRGWDLMIAHPDCTFLTVSGARWMREEYREEAQLMALHFVKSLWKFPIERIAIENPIGKLSSLWRGPDQIIEPFHFGDPFKKATCLWLKNLPPLEKTNDLGSGEQACWKEPPSPDRWKNRARTYQGIANAMADQWGKLPAIQLAA